MLLSDNDDGAMLVGAFNQEKALVGAFSVIAKPIVKPMELFTALVRSVLRRAI